MATGAPATPVGGDRRALAPALALALAPALAPALAAALAPAQAPGQGQAPTPAKVPSPPPAAYSWSRREPPRTAPTSLRVSAFALDLVVLASLTYAAWKLAGLFGFLPAAGALGAYGFLLIAELPIGLLYFTACEAISGRTLGKGLVGLRVATLAGGPATAFQAFLRNLVRFAWMTPVGPVFVLVDAWLLWTTEMDQRLGDLAAGTIVVDTREATGSA